MDIAVSGCLGRMGKALVKKIVSDPHLTLTQGITSTHSPYLGQDLGPLCGLKSIHVPVHDTLQRSPDGLIDFSTPQSSVSLVKHPLLEGKKVVIGTTGFSAQEFECLKQASQKMAMVWAPNMSVGVNVVSGLLETAAKILGDEYDIEITEAHHRYKKDAPSGTALSLGQTICHALGIQLNDVAEYGRQGQSLERQPKTIGFSTIRAGGIIGDHNVLFASEDERVEIRHQAITRECFVQGALRAVQWLTDKPFGFYSMKDVLFNP